MLIFGCYEIRTECESCGQPVPINGPMRTIACSYCFHRVEITPDRYKSLLADLLEEYDELADGEGRGGQMISDRTYHYGYWRVPPRCRACKKPLELGAVDLGTSGELACPCGQRYASFPAPDWLIAELPTAAQCYCADREPQPVEGADGTLELVEVHEDAPEPVVMACPQCGGALKITVESDRVHECQYCQSNVYIPDPLWRRLHPVKQVHEWWLGFEQAQVGRSLEPEDSWTAGELTAVSDAEETIEDPSAVAPFDVASDDDATIDVVDVGDDRLFMLVAFAIIAGGVGILLAILVL